MKKLLLLCYLLIASSPLLLAQTPKVAIRGQVQDTLKAPLAFSSVLLLLPQDSSLVAYTLTDEKGNFSFRNVKRQSYLLKATFVGYLPEHQPIKLSNEEQTDLGVVQLKPISKELYEVVVKTAKAPISIRGDTIEYDASKFKVPPGSTVEDLLRKLPGVEVLQDGTINAQGEQVRRVTVDGKRFFGDDTKMATRNLGADAVKKVQVFNDKSEQSKITGVDDGKREKTVNLELKDEAKKGGFGKLKAGVGTDSRATLSGNYNKFDSKNQFAILGFGNNINQTGMSWDDFQEFRGSNAFQWGDDGDFGFNSNSGVRFFMFSDEDDSESFSMPIGGESTSDGFSKNLAGGINYNYDHKKNQFSSSYFYNRTRHLLDTKAATERFLDNFTLTNRGTNSQNNLTGNHRVTLRGQTQFDSTHTFTFIGNGRLSNREINYGSFNESFRSLTEKATQSTIANSSDRLSYAMASTLIYRKSFKKNKARNFAASGTYSLNNYDTEAIQKSVNEFFQATDVNAMQRNINQLQNTLGRNNELKSSLLYIEPLSKKFYWESFYNISMRQNDVDRKVFDRNEAGGQTANANLTRNFQNEILYNRLGTSFRYSHQGINITGGLAGVQFDLSGKMLTASSAFPAVQKQFRVLTPYAAFTWAMKNNRYLNLDYSLGAEAPSANDLQPVVDNSNPLYLREGNPSLLPQKTHSVSANFNKFDPASFTSLYFGSRYGYNINQIVYNQTIDPILFITSTKPMNVSGGQSLNNWIGFGFPIIKTKLTVNVNSSIDYNKYLAFINNVQNTTNSFSYGVGPRVSFTPSDKFTLYANAYWRVGDTKYSISTAQNQQIYSSNYSAEMNVKLPKDFYITTNFDYRTYKNERFNFDQRVPILNMSVYRQFGKQKKLEGRLAAYDLFKQNVGIRQFANQNIVSQTQTATLSRYYMVSLTYNMRGITTNLRKRWF